MNEVMRIAKRLLCVAMGAATIGVVGHSGAAQADEISVALSGQNEIPPVTTPERSRMASPAAAVSTSVVPPPWSARLSSTAIGTAVGEVTYSVENA